MVAGLVIVGMLICMALGVPIFLSLGIPSLLYFLFTDPALILLLPQRMVAGVDSFSFLAIPFFILTGEVMNLGGLTERLFTFARKLVGFIPGGLGHANVLASCMFASMSGSAVADTAGLGLIEMKAMADAGYDEEFSIGITVASSTIGPIIPPSINMVIFGSISGAAIGDLFLGGIIPGLMMGLGMMILVYIISRKRDYPVDPIPTAKELFISFRRAALPLLTPLIIIGGILGGIFTPTEAAAISSMYAFIIAGLVYRELNKEKIIEMLLSTIKSTGTILIIIALSSALAYILTREMIPQAIAEFLFTISSNTPIIWLLIIMFLLLVGMFMEVGSSIIVLTPILVPAVQALNFDLVHFGVIMVLGLGIGLITPPVGMCLYVGANVADLPVSTVIKETSPYVIPIFTTLLLCTFIPQLVLFIPNLF